MNVKFLKTPNAFSNRNSASFVFEVLDNSSGNGCTDCITNCTLDHNITSKCDDKKAFYVGLNDGNHTFSVCTNGSRGVDCATYNWIIDTVPPTANVTAATYFTSTVNVPVNISFSETCNGEGGFRCSSTNSCNLIVYGPGQVVPSTLRVLKPNLKYSITVRLSTSVEYGRVILVTDKNFCTDSAGNKFSRTENSWFVLRFDRRKVRLSLRTHVPEKLIQLDSETRTVQATNNHDNLKAYLYLSEPIVNSSAEILRSVHVNRGSLVPINANTIGMRKFGFMVEEVPSMSVVTIEVDPSLIISRQGTPVTPVAPVTFLYDSERPAVSLSTKSSSRTRENSISAWVKFTEPVYDFNSSHVSIGGGHLLSFQEVSKKLYVVETKPINSIISITIPENITQDIAGNRNTASNTLQIRHYSMPIISTVFCIFATAAFATTALIAGFLTLSTATLQSVGAYSRPSSFLTSDPARNLFRIACHIQVFALSRWLAPSLPVEYLEFAKGIQWSIPYLCLPWDSSSSQPLSFGSNPRPYSSKLDISDSLYGLPLTPSEYVAYFESPSMKPEAQYLSAYHDSNGWKEFGRLMFWLAVISASLILLHILILFALKLKKKSSEKQGSFGSIIFPRFEFFLVILAVPPICQASTTLIKGGETSGAIVGILLLGVASFLLLALFIFLSIGITFGKLLQYKEVHQDGQEVHWYTGVIRATLGPGKRGQWTWRNRAISNNLTIFGPLFEDLRGPPKYMVSQISLGNPPKQGDAIIASEDETEDAEAPFIQKVFGILRIYYTLIEGVKRVCLGIIAGFYSEKFSSKASIIVLLAITSFQLFFMILKKPFIKKKVQLVEIISISSELGIFVTCFVLSEMEFSDTNETKIGIFMLSLFLFAFLAQMLNEWLALYRQTKQLDPRGESFFLGLKVSGLGILLFFLPRKWTRNLENKLLSNQQVDEPHEPLSFGDGQRNSESRKSSGLNDKPWLKQLRKMAKASFSKPSVSSNMFDPSPSQPRWSGFLSMKRSGSSSTQKSSADYRGRRSRLYKDLENIFASNK